MTARILVVDDEPDLQALIQQKFGKVAPFDRGLYAKGTSGSIGVDVHPRRCPATDLSCS